MLKVINVTKYWVEGGLVLHNFYQKPMKSSCSLMEASAMGENAKWSTLPEPKDNLEDEEYFPEGLQHHPV